MGHRGSMIIRSSVEMIIGRDDYPEIVVGGGEGDRPCQNEFFLGLHNISSRVDYPTWVSGGR